MKVHRRSKLDIKMIYLIVVSVFLCVLGVSHSPGYSGSA